MQVTVYRQGPDISAEIVYSDITDDHMLAEDVVTDVLNGPGLSPGSYAMLLASKGWPPGVYMFTVGTV